MSIMKFTFVVKLEYYYEYLKYYSMSQRRKSARNEQQRARNAQEFVDNFFITN